MKYLDLISSLNAKPDKPTVYLNYKLLVKASYNLTEKHSHTCEGRYLKGNVICEYAFIWN
jgi:hypothetical protein